MAAFAGNPVNPVNPAGSLIEQPGCHGQRTEITRGSRHGAQRGACRSPATGPEGGVPPVKSNILPK